ncbi:probable leucine-rich repeat receptor-like protein kinase At1g35710 [Ziziphus jujuba]|uniref:Probable leucine-rich repeat receptor-like protein kinase At1g35710 n=1 Tax=Ziziphus jujuba TaxID=326968 RepID=A0A6P3ZH61_ZIZJJ|nr:probable leucine-rich repeat receptor-like protein kinase At1g35710 [Ziziphus jujuba]
MMLAFSHDDISGDIPEELGRLKSCYTEALTIGQLEEPCYTRLELQRFPRYNPSGSLSIDQTNLAHLDISYNFIQGELPLSLINPSNSVMLDTSNNQFNGIISSILGQLRSTYLKLNRNQIEGSIPYEIGNLINQGNLDLSDNMLNLTELYLGNRGQTYRQNQLTDSVPSSTGNLKKLTILDLSFNGLGGKIPSEVGNMMHLSHLDLGHKRLSGNIPPCLVSLQLRVDLLVQFLKRSNSSRV